MEVKTHQIDGKRKKEKSCAERGGRGDLSSG